MARFTIGVPDGRKITIEAADQNAAVAGAKDWVSKNPVQQAAPQPQPQLQPAPQSGQIPDGDPLRTLPLFGPAYGLAKDIATAKPQDPNYQPSAIPVLDPINAYANNFVKNLPMVGSSLDQFGNKVDAAVNNAIPGMQQETPEQRSQINDQTSAAFPAYSAAGAVSGPIAGWAGLGAAAPGLMGLGEANGLGGTLANAGKSLLSTGAITTADNMSRGQSPQEALQNAIAPAGLAGLIPLAGGAVRGVGRSAVNAVNDARQSAATTRAVADAPTASELKAQGSALFKQVDASGVTVNTPAFSQFVNNVAQNARKEGIDQQLDPRAWQAYQRLIGALGDVQSKNASLTLSELHTLRKIAQRAAMGATTPEEGRFANQIVDGIDGFVTSKGALSSPSGGAPLLQAISTWGQGARTQTIQNAIEAGGNMASGTENGVRLQFLGLLRNERFMNSLSPAQRQAVEQAAHGDLKTNAARILGVLGVSATNRVLPALVTGAGLAGGIPGLIGSAAAVGASTLAKKAAEAARLASAERAMRAAATPNIPSPAQFTGIPSAALAGLPIVARGMLTEPQQGQYQ